MDCERVRKVIVDQLYDENLDVDIRGHINTCSECREYKESLQDTMSFMDTLDIHIPVDTMEISKAINGAFDRASLKKKRSEVIYFITAALLILTLVILASLTIGMSFFIVLQIVAVLNLPLMLIPILRSRDIKEESI